MTETQAFMAAIIANPDDDAPRLIYADWLDDRGDGDDGARAEFIRVQCELAKLPKERSGGLIQWSSDEAAADSQCNENPHRERLQRREQELARGLTLAFWAADLPCPGLVVNGTMWRRGFVEVVTCTWEQWLYMAERLLEGTPLREVRLKVIPEPEDVGETDEERMMRLLTLEWPSIKFVLQLSMSAHDR